MVLSQVYDSEKGGTEPETPTECVVVFPRAGNFLEFDGTLAHGVLDSTAQETRMTFLINFWDHRPEVSVLNWSLLIRCTSNLHLRVRTCIAPLPYCSARSVHSSTPRVHECVKCELPCRRAKARDITDIGLLLQVRQRLIAC